MLKRDMGSALRDEPAGGVQEPVLVPCRQPLVLSESDGYGMPVSAPEAVPTGCATRCTTQREVALDGPLLQVRFLQLSRISMQP